MKMKMLNNLQILFQMKKNGCRRDYRKQSHDSGSQKRHRRRRNQTTEEQNYSEQRGNSKISQQSIKYERIIHITIRISQVHMFLQLMVLRRKRTSQKHIICILIIQIIVLKIQLQIITKKV